MTPAVADYLDSVKDNLRLEPSDEKEVLSELETHISDKLEELRQAGLSEEDANNSCLELLGSAEVVANQIYAARTQGTWGQALLASMPHLFFASLFALNWLHSSRWLILMVALVGGMAVVFLVIPDKTVHRWFNGKPSWLLSWLGYSLLPVVTTGLLILHLPKGWLWLAALVYIPLAIWLLYRTAIQNIRKDWLYNSLALLPVPIAISWFLVVAPEIGFSGFTAQRVQEFSPWIGLSLLSLGATVAIFIRLKERRLRGAMLLTSGLLTLSMVLYYAGGRLGLATIFLLILLMISFLLGPALLERRLRRGKWLAGGRV